MTSKYRLGIDIGGTFTDATLIDEETGTVHVVKVPSTPSKPSSGFINAALRVLEEADVAPSELSYVVHGTTVATNAIIEGNIARTAFVTTEGFSDMLEIARQTRPTLYDLRFVKPKPLVPRHLSFGIPERVDARGNTVTPLNETSVADVARQLKIEGVESVAVCFLHSYANAEHEQRTGRLLQKFLPGVPISLSTELASEFREYFRASTTVVNASVRPIVARYLKGIEERLRKEGVDAELLVMQSSGGIFTFEAAMKQPVSMVESGPAAGVIAATYLGQTLGHGDVISFDMGGTTAKAALVQNGSPKVTKEYEVGATAASGSGASRGKGYPIRTPVIDLVEIGAGGGSIAWVDSGGAMRVGPQSAGAVPGPACYNKGGTEPTVTDANMVLGRLNPQHLLGGELSINMNAARKAIEKKCAQPLGMSLVEAAVGIIEIANSAMVNTLRLVSVQRGYDPRDFILIAFGGAGPVHANRLAEELAAPITMIPMSPGTTSAIGLLSSDLKHEYATTLIRQLGELDPKEAEKIYRKLEVQGSAALTREGITDAQKTFTRQIDMRYVGQSYELTVQMPDCIVSPDSLDTVVTSFHKEHERAYGHSATSEPVEVVTLRSIAVGNIARPNLRTPHREESDSKEACPSLRPVYFSEIGDFVDCPIYDRYLLKSGETIEGPGIIEEMDSTTVLHPGWMAKIDSFGNLLLIAQRL